MTKYFFCFLLIAFTIGCANNASNEQKAGKTSEVEEPYVDSAQQQIEIAFPGTYNFFQQQDSSFDISNFEEVGFDSVIHRSLPVTEGLKAYYPYFIYNSDSSYAVDLYSYNVLFVNRRGKTVAQKGEPDTEVALVDLKNNTRKRIFFGGSSSVVLDAKWIDNHRFLLLTGEVVEGNEFRPAVLRYDVNTNLLDHFVYNDTLHLNAADYSDRRLPQ